MSTPTANVPKRLITPTQLAASVGTLYTSPSGQKGTRITEIILINTGSASTTATLYHVPSGGTAGVTNVIANAIIIPADGFPVILDLGGVIMNASDTIQGLAGAASQITIHIFGIEMN
jgi:hypothetical protein